MASNRGSPATICYAPFQLQRKRGAHPTRSTIQDCDQPDNWRRHAVTLASVQTAALLGHHVIQLPTQRGATQLTIEYPRRYHREPNHACSPDPTLINRTTRRLSPE